MKYIRILLLALTAFFLISGITYAEKPNPQRVEVEMIKVFKNFLDRPPSNAPYEGAEKRSEITHFRDLLASAEGRDSAQLKRALENKIREMIDIITNRDEYRNKIKPMNWTRDYWTTFVAMVQSDFELEYNQTPGPAKSKLIQRAVRKEWGNDMRRTQDKIMLIYKEGAFFGRYVSDIAKVIMTEPPVVPSYGAMVNRIFQQFLDRKPSGQGGASSEFNRFKEQLESAGTNLPLLSQKVREVVNAITDRNEFRDKAGFAEWSIKYWTKFIKLCAKTFEDRVIGDDTKWANDIVMKKNQYKTIKRAQNSIMNQFKKSDQYNAWVKELSGEIGGGAPVGQIAK